MEKYQKLECLGSGTFGEVFKCTNRTTGQTVAAKVLKKKFKNWDDCLQLAQVKALRKLVHPGIVKLKQLILVKEQVYMIFQFHNKDLLNYYKSSKEPISQSELVQIAKQLAETMAFVHKNGFFHRDIKPQNILVTEDKKIKIIDFGIAKEIRSKPPFTDYISTRWYRAPQVLLKSNQYSGAIDVFAYACVLAQLVLQKPLFSGASQLDQLGKILTLMGTPSRQEWAQGYKLATIKGFSLPYFQTKEGLRNVFPNLSSKTIDYFQQCLQVDSRKRPSFSTLLNHQIFKADKSQFLKSRTKSFSSIKIQRSLSSFKKQEEKPSYDSKEINRSLLKDRLIKNIETPRKLGLGLMALQVIRKRY